MITIDESSAFRVEWEKEFSQLGRFDGKLFEEASENLMFVAVLVRPSCHYVVMHLGMELWGCCVRMSPLYGSVPIKLRVAVTKANIQDGKEISDSDFEERICEFTGRPGPYPTGGHFSFDKMRHKFLIRDGNMWFT